MSGDGTFPLQTALYTVLSADSAIAALGASVFDFVPKDQAPPYVKIGEDTGNWDGTMGVDWNNLTVTIHSYTYGEGKKDIKQLMSAVYDALHKVGLTISGKTHVSTLFEFSDVFDEDDGSNHGVQRFRVILHEPF